MNTQATAPQEVQQWFDEAFAPVKVKAPKVSKPRKASSEEETTYEYARSTSGEDYIVDPVKRTCRKVSRIVKSFDEIPEDISVLEMSMTAYQRYLKDRFNNEDAPIKKGKLHFRGYRISCTSENGFLVEDTYNKYAVVDLEMEGIPTPKELGDWFEKKSSKRVHTPEELSAAYELGKSLTKKAEDLPEEQKEVDYEDLRKKVIRQIDRILEKVEPKFDPAEFVGMIPFRKWNRRAKALLRQWANKEIRYAKFLKELRTMTEEMEFVVVTQKKVKFKGAVLPGFKTIGRLLGDKLEVDGGLIDAVPFMTDYILHYEPKGMPQLMRYAKGMCTKLELLEDPIYVDPYIEYSSKALPNTAENAQLLSAFAEALGVVAPQDILFDESLNVGDKILFYDMANDEWRTTKIKDTSDGIEISGGYGLTKFHKWIKL